MKPTLLASFVVVAVLQLAPLWAQSQPVPVPPPILTPGSDNQLTRFDLDFPGGTPRELVAAIEKAMGRPLNAIIPDEHADQRLPALKMRGVDTVRLFDALSKASETYAFAGNVRQHMRFGFFAPQSPQPSDETIWYFRVEGGIPLGFRQQNKESTVHLLTPYLEQGLTVDDITTAIQTSWRMLGDPIVPPSLTFHKETQLLIAVGDTRFLATIDRVLDALRKPSPKPSQTPAPESAPEKASKS